MKLFLKSARGAPTRLDLTSTFKKSYYCSFHTGSGGGEEVDGGGGGQGREGKNRFKSNRWVTVSVL